jgi:DNA adenine methylase
MELLISRRVRHVYINDSSRHIYAFWKTILNQPEAFCRRIARASLSVEAWKRHREVVRHPEDHDLTELGFSTFFLNRCNRSGVLTAGVIGSQKQSGRWRIDARFPRNELIGRIELIASRRRQITVTNLDAEQFMLTRVNKLPAETLVYCDPPYYERAERLYMNSYQPADHARLAATVQRQLKRPWLVSYDGHPAVLALYAKRRKFTYALQYSAMQAYAGTEVFMFSDRLKLPTMSSLPYINVALGDLCRSCSAPRLDGTLLMR